MMQTVSMIGSSKRTVSKISYSNKSSKRNGKLQFLRQTLVEESSGKVLRTCKKSEKKLEQTLGLKSWLEEEMARTVLR